jgi:ribonuclease P protein component, eubacterial
LSLLIALRPETHAAMEDLPKSQRLHGQDCLGALFREGSRGASGTLAVRALPNGLDMVRMAAVAGKSLGKASRRSRMRRRIRAAFRMSKDSLPPGWDFALIARPGLLEASWREIMRDLAEAATRAVRAGSASPRRAPKE